MSYLSIDEPYRLFGHQKTLALRYAMFELEGPRVDELDEPRRARCTSSPPIL